MIFNVAHNAKTLGCTAVCYFKVRLLQGLVLGEGWRGGTPNDGLHRGAPTETGVQFLFQAGGISKGRDIQLFKRAF